MKDWNYPGKRIPHMRGSVVRWSKCGLGGRRIDHSGVPDSRLRYQAHLDIDYSCLKVGFSLGNMNHHNEGRSDLCLPDRQSYRDRPSFKRRRWYSDLRTFIRTDPRKLRSEEEEAKKERIMKYIYYKIRSNSPYGS